MVVAIVIASALWLGTSSPVVRLNSERKEAASVRRQIQADTRTHLIIVLSIARAGLYLPDAQYFHHSRFRHQNCVEPPASIDNLLEGRKPTINILANLIFRKTISLLKPTF